MRNADDAGCLPVYKEASWERCMKIPYPEPQKVGKPCKHLRWSLSVVIFFCMQLKKDNEIGNTTMFW